MSGSTSRTKCALILLAVTVLIFVHGTPLLADDGAQVAPINRITGTVVDHRGKPVSGVHVAAANTKLGYISYRGNGKLYVYGPKKRILLLFKARNGSASAEDHTDAEGKFVLSNLMDGKVNLIAAHPEHGVWFLENIDPFKEAKPLGITLPKPRYVEGRIRGIPEQTVSSLFGGDRRVGSIGRFEPAEPESGNAIMWNMTTRVPADGRFRIGPIPTHINQWKMTFDQRVPNYSATLLEAPISVSDGNGLSIDVDLSQGHKMTGIVRGPKDELLANVSIAARRSDGIVIGGVTDSKGAYEINGVTDGTLHVEAKRWAKRTAPG